MSTQANLDNRLRLCAEFVRPDSRPADIGTDHAYLPVWLCRNGICPSAIAADINPEPLKRGRETVVQAGMSGVVELRLSDGLSAIGEGEADDIIIAGMGGELIAKIIADCPYAKRGDLRFILQPMTRSEALIKYLCSEGFEIIRQDCCEASGKVYTVLCVSFSGKPQPCGELFPYTGRLKPAENEMHRRFIEKNISRLRKMAAGDEKYKAIADRLEALCDNG